MNESIKLERIKKEKKATMKEKKNLITKNKQECREGRKKEDTIKNLIKKERNKIKL